MKELQSKFYAYCLFIGAFILFPLMILIYSVILIIGVPIGWIVDKWLRRKYEESIKK